MLERVRPLDRGRGSGQREGVQSLEGHHLVGLVEEEAEVGEDHPQLLPAVAVLELPQEVP